MANEIIRVPWQDIMDHDRIEYDFVVLKPHTKMTTADTDGNLRQNRFKSVYEGFFLEPAPPGLESNVRYFLKEIHAQDHYVWTHQFPQSRERYDLMDYHGRHLRKILAKNEYAKNVEEELKNTGDCTKTEKCFTVEQPYSVLECSDQLEMLTVWERLEYVAQVCRGLQELYSHKIHSRRIIVHRDIKFGNGMIIRYPDRFVVVLDDFASVRFDQDPQNHITAENLPHLENPDAKDGQKAQREHHARQQGTAPYLMSPENTAPELVDGQYSVVQETDVYALGNMLASMFGHTIGAERNPNQAFGKPSWDLDLQNRAGNLCARFRAAKALDTADKYTGTTWLEESLREMATPFIWGNKTDSPFAPSPELLYRIKELFFRSTRIDPQKRISVSEFAEELENILNELPQERSNSRLLYAKNETVFLFHQKDLTDFRNALVRAVTDDSMANRFPVRYCWYQNPLDDLASDHTHGFGKEFSASAESLEQDIRERNIYEGIGCTSLVHALKETANWYHFEKYGPKFSGEIHIFTQFQFSPKIITDFCDNGSVYTYWDAQDQLSALSAQHKSPGQSGVHFLIHSPEPPQIRKNMKNFEWYEISDNPSQASDWVPVQRSPVKAPEQPVRPKQPERARMEEREEEALQSKQLENKYIIGKEGLFALVKCGDEKHQVYVSKKRTKG